MNLMTAVATAEAVKKIIAAVVPILKRLLRENLQRSKFEQKFTPHKWDFSAGISVFAGASWPPAISGAGLIHNNNHIKKAPAFAGAFLYS